MVSLSPGQKVLAELRGRKALRIRLSSSLALDDYEDLSKAIYNHLPEGVSRANPSAQVATLIDSLGYFRTAPPHEQKIALMRLHGVPDHQIASRLQMSPPVFRAVSNQMLARFTAHRGDVEGGGLTVSPQQSTGVARREGKSGPRV
ncbi:MAG: hypothetical protein WCJ35_24000 [Planctomycetota bacterium]